MLTRREVLKGMAYTAAGLFVAERIADQLGWVDRIYPNAPEAQALMPEFIGSGVQIISKGSKF